MRRSMLKIVLAPVALAGIATLLAAGSARAINQPITVDDPTFVFRTVEASIEFGAPDMPAIPADFFYPGSNPFSGEVLLQGEPIRPDDDGDLVIRGSGTLLLPPAPSTTTIPIELVELNLVSITPIQITGTQPPIDVDIFIKRDVSPSSGVIKIDRDGDDFGTVTYEYDSLLILRRTVDPSETVRDLPSIPLVVPPTTPIPWEWIKPIEAPSDTDFYVPPDIDISLFTESLGFKQKVKQARRAPQVPALQPPALGALVLIALLGGLGGVYWMRAR